MFGFLKKMLNPEEETMFEKEIKKNNSSSNDNNYYSANNYVAGDFRITVEDVFSITGRGTVIVGKVESGSVSVGDTVKILDSNGYEKQITTVTGIEMFRKLLNTATVGDNVGLLLRGVDRNAVKRGDVIVK